MLAQASIHGGVMTPTIALDGAMDAGLRQHDNILQPVNRPETKAGAGPQALPAGGSLLP